jgi:hypothetical protein
MMQMGGIRVSGGCLSFQRSPPVLIPPGPAAQALALRLQTQESAPLALPPRAPGRSLASIRIGSGYALFPARAGPCRKEEGAMHRRGQKGGLPSVGPISLVGWHRRGWLEWGS